MKACTIINVLGFKILVLVHSFTDNNSEGFLSEVGGNLNLGKVQILTRRKGSSLHNCSVSLYPLIPGTIGDRIQGKKDCPGSLVLIHISSEKPAVFLSRCHQHWLSRFISGSAKLHCIQNLPFSMTKRSYCPDDLSWTAVLRTDDLILTNNCPQGDCFLFKAWMTIPIASSLGQGSALHYSVSACWAHSDVMLLLLLPLFCVFFFVGMKGLCQRLDQTQDPSSIASCFLQGPTRDLEKPICMAWKQSSTNIQR